MNEEKINIGRLLALRRVRAKIAELSASMDELGEPTLSDMSLLPVIHDTYLAFFRRRGKEGEASKVYHRQKFILIALYLYSPRTLVGGKMRVGLRDRLSELFGLSAKTTISDNSARALLLYRHYRDFRYDVDLILADIFDTLGGRAR